MQILLFAVFCCVYGVRSQASNTISTLTLVPSSQSNCEESARSPQTLMEATKSKQDKFSCVLNLLKEALSEELENSQSMITPDASQESIVSSLNTILEEKQVKENELEKLGVIKNETDVESDIYQKIITKIASAFSKPKNITEQNVTKLNNQSNITNNQNNMEVPSMIPIFKPKKTASITELNQNIADFSSAPATRPIPKSRAVSFVPEKIIQTNMSPIPSQALFNIPCQRAADVLDMTNIAVPKEAVSRNVIEKSNLNPVVDAPKPNLPSNVAPVTLSVDCADSDDTVAMLFKPKNISLMQVYGNLLKKITITVLVPYHISKLGSQ